jgi:hypothetical protein
MYSGCRAQYPCNRVQCSVLGMYCRGDGVQLLYNCMYPDACSLLCNILFSVILKTNIDFKIESEDSIEWRMVLQRKTLHSMVSNLMLIIVKVGGDLERRNSWGSTLYSASSAIRSSSKSALLTPLKKSIIICTSIGV